MIYVHIGAGAGDLDAGALFRDGFSEFVKKNDDQNKKIYLVEANPSNISKLKISKFIIPISPESCIISDSLPSIG